MHCWIQEQKSLSKKIELQLGVPFVKSNKRFKAAYKTAIKLQSMVKLPLKMNPNGTALLFTFYVFDEEYMDEDTVILVTPFIRLCDFVEFVHQRIIYC